MLLVAGCCRLNDARQSKVGDLDDELVGDEYVARRQVAMNYLTVITEARTQHYLYSRVVVRFGRGRGMCLQIYLLPPDSEAS